MIYWVGLCDPSVDLRDSGIRMQRANPGFIATRLTAKNRFHMPRLMTPEDAAAHVLRHMRGQRFSANFPAPFAWLFSLGHHLPLRLFQSLFRARIRPMRIPRSWSGSSTYRSGNGNRMQSGSAGRLMANADLSHVKRPMVLIGNANLGFCIIGGPSPDRYWKERHVRLMPDDKTLGRPEAGRPRTPG